MMEVTANMNTDVFENTRKFNPRKHRSCHRRSEPVSEKKRKEESSKNSREYTKRNRDEIRVCQNQYEDIEAKRKRIQEIIEKEYKPEVVEVNVSIAMISFPFICEVFQVIRAVRVFEEIMRRHTAVGDNVREFLNVPSPDGFLEGESAVFCFVRMMIHFQITVRKPKQLKTWHSKLESNLTRRNCKSCTSSLRPLVQPKKRWLVSH